MDQFWVPDRVPLDMASMTACRHCYRGWKEGVHYADGKPIAMCYCSTCCRWIHTSCSKDHAGCCKTRPPHTVVGFTCMVCSGPCAVVWCDTCRGYAHLGCIDVCCSDATKEDILAVRDWEWPWSVAVHEQGRQWAQEWEERDEPEAIADQITSSASKKKNIWCLSSV